MVAATDLSGHPLALSGDREVGVILSRSPCDTPVRTTTDEIRNEYRFRVTTPAERHLVSVEALAESGGAGRARLGGGLTQPTSGGMGVSNLLLFNWDATLEETLEAVHLHMLGTTELSEGAEVGVFWEVYGLDDDESLSVSLRVVPEDVGFLQRLGQALRLVGPDEGVRLSWEAPGDLPEGESVLRTSLSVDLGTLDPGKYRLELTVERDGESLTEARRFSVQ